MSDKNWMRAGTWTIKSYLDDVLQMTDTGWHGFREGFAVRPITVGDDGAGNGPQVYGPGGPTWPQASIRLRTHGLLARGVPVDNVQLSAVFPWCTLTFTPDDAVYLGLHGRNMVWINGKPAWEHQRLAFGDVMQIGRYTVTFEINEEGAT